MLTPHQTEALDTRRHLSVTANAGAGKTTVLVRRYLDILRTGSARVHEIVAITFTEKAASELRKKIADEIEARIAEPGAVPAETARLVAARNALASATIGTIHGFCAQILREYPVEADVDAVFTVLEETDQQSLLQESLTELLSGLLANRRGTPEAEAVVDAIRLLGKKAFLGHLRAFLSNREKLERLLADPGGLYAGSDAGILAHWRETAAAEIARIVDDPAWGAAVDEVLGACTGKKKKEDAVELLRSYRAARGARRLDALGAFAEALFTQKGGVRRDLAGRGTQLPESAETYLSSSAKTMLPLLSALTAPGAAEADASLLRTTRTLLDVYRGAAALYEEKKQDQGGLDFEDLQLKARNLLAVPAIRATLSERYRFVMVDEFQDTNQLQYDLLRSLIAEFGAANLFIVGDPKQSIYGFRNAEVEVFSAAKDEIVELGRGAALTLAESFRPLSQVALFVNAVFSRLMGASGSSFDIPYADLVRGRASAAAGRVELHLLPAEAAPGETADAVARECETIARRILELHRSGHPISRGRAEEPSPFQFRDAAILLRTRTHLRQVEHALVKYHVPYLLSGGIGFYQTQEIVDFLNYFSFLLNPENDVALAGILRSPFFTVSDLALYEIALVRGGGSFWDKLRSYASGRPAGDPAASAAAVLAEDLSLANRLSIPLLVQRIFRETGWRGTVAGLSRGAQHAANIAKLLRIAREFEARGLSTLYDFVQRLQALVRSEDREGQASLDLGGNAVHVMTIHAAKGLEFPAVFLPFAHAKFRYDASPLIDTTVGIGFALQEEEDHDAQATIPALALLRMRNKQRIEAEEKRIFYVAATRARDLLAVSGRLPEEGLRTSYLRWIGESLGLDPAALSGPMLTLPGAPLAILATEGGELVQRTLDLPLELHVNAPLAQAAAPASRTSAQRPDGRDDGRYLAPLSAQTRGEFFSATQVRTFLECPSKYYLKYVLGLPESSAPPVAFDEEEEPSDVIVGEAEGAYTHAVLQEIAAGDIAEEELRRRAAELITAETSLPEAKRAALAERVVANVLNFLRSAEGREVLSADEMRTEFSVQAAFGDDYLTGIIDRLYKTAQGEWRIIDYKTDRVDARGLAQRAALYRPQLAFYAVLVRRLFRQEAVSAALIFLKHPERPVRYEFSGAEIDAFEGELRSVIGKIRAGDFSRELPQCASCTYDAGHGCMLPQRGR